MNNSPCTLKTNIMKLSIIVPVYNSEKYLEACVASLYRQKISETDFEVILVNDGSTDGSCDIAARFQQEHANLHIIHQPNQGLSAARNTGLEHAKGQYIWFVDSDDEITDCLHLLLAEIQQNKDVDLLGVVIDKLDPNKKHVEYQYKQPSLPHNKVISGSSAIILGYHPSSAYSLIMRREFLIENNLRFMLGITHEDVEFTYRAMAVAQRVVFTHHIAYNYYLWEDTLSRPKDTKRLLKYIIDDVEVAKSFTQLAQQVQNKELASAILNRRNNILFGLTYSLFRNSSDWKARGINQAVVSELKACGFYPITFKLDSWKKRLSTLLLNREWILR